MFANLGNLVTKSSFHKLLTVLNLDIQALHVKIHPFSSTSNSFILCEDSGTFELH